MSSSIGKLADNLAVGKTPNEFPIQGLRQFLLPAQLTYVKFFLGETPDHVESIIAYWVLETQNIVVVAGPLTYEPETSKFSVAVTYVPAYRESSNG